MLSAILAAHRKVFTDDVQVLLAGLYYTPTDSGVTTLIITYLNFSEHWRKI